MRLPRRIQFLAVAFIAYMCASYFRLGRRPRHPSSSSSSSSTAASASAPSASAASAAVRGGGGGGTTTTITTPASALASGDAASPPSARIRYPYTCEALAHRSVSDEIAASDLLWAMGPTTGGPPGVTTTTTMVAPWSGQDARAGPHARRTFWVDVVNASCPRYIGTHVNGAAGVGHRYSNWIRGLDAAIYYNITYAFSFSWASGVHGDYAAWERMLGLGRGHLTLEEARAIPGIKVVGLSCPSSSQAGETMTDRFYEQHWGRAIRDPENCNALFVIPTDCWCYDAVTRTKPFTAYKFLAAGDAAKRDIDVLWVRSHVNIAVHVRKGDVYATPESTHAGIIRGTILPHLRRAGIRAPVSVHVFAEFDGADAFPELAALTNEPAPQPWDWDGAAPLRNVNVTFYPGLPARAAVYHFTQSDFLVVSESGFSALATTLSLRPLVLSVPNSDLMRHCQPTSACCDHQARCTFEAHMKMRAAADRILAADTCGLLEGR
jgi:hypothetical protein